MASLPLDRLSLRRHFSAKHRSCHSSTRRFGGRSRYPWNAACASDKSCLELWNQDYA